MGAAASKDVPNNVKSTPARKTGGVTGKGFMPGQSGNPNGRPKDMLTQALRQQLTPEAAKELATTLLNLAKSGELKALTEVWDRIEGKSIARQEQGKPGEFDGLEALKDMTADELRKIVSLDDARKEKAL